MTKINFTPFPILTADRLTLRQLSISDQHDIFALRSDPAVNQYLDRQPSQTIEDAVNFINKINDSIKLNQSLYWAITLTATQTFVGTICLFDFAEEQNSCEIGFELMPKFQRKGIMAATVQVVIDFVFETLKFKRIVAFVHHENQASNKLLLKFNFVKSVETDQENPHLNVLTLTPSS